MAISNGSKAWLAAALAFACVSGAMAAAPGTLPVPKIFAPGVVSGPANDGSPTFSPDGNTLFFTRSGAGYGTIMESHRVHGQWTQPRIAPFSGTWPDSSPELARDGSYLVFVELRRAPAGDPGKPAQAVAHLWRVDRIGKGWDTWSKPVELPAAVNIGDAVWKASMADDGSIYFVSIDPGKGKGKRLYVAHRANGAYAPAQALPFSHYGDGDVDPEIVPDGSYLIFSSDHRLPGDSKDHLFVVFRRGDGWGAVRPIRYAGDDANGYSSDNEPHIGPSGRTLYFGSDRSMPVARYPHSPAQARAYLQRVEQWDNGNNNAWSLPLAPLLDAAKAGG